MEFVRSLSRAWAGAREKPLIQLVAVGTIALSLLLATHDPTVVDFGVEHGWRCARLVDGELLDVDLPPSRPVRHDEETEGFGTRESPDDTEVIRVVRA